MNTPSHIILHLGIRKYLQGKNIDIPKSFVFGALAPDLGLLLCILLYIPISLLILGNTQEYTFQHMFENMYFENPIWIFAYNLFHSPLMLIGFIFISYLFKNFLGKYYKILLWFFMGCGLHTAFDIPLHHNDGTRIFYPFFEYVFHSPISYWNTDYYAYYVIPIELAGCILIVSYLLIQRFKK